MYKLYKCFFHIIYLHSKKSASFYVTMYMYEEWAFSECCVDVSPFLIAELRMANFSNTFWCQISWLHIDLVQRPEIHMWKTHHTVIKVMQHCGFTQKITFFYVSL